MIAKKDDEKMFVDFAKSLDITLGKNGDELEVKLWYKGEELAHSYVQLNKNGGIN